MSTTTKHSNLELTILMPCLNEAKTLGKCIAQASGYLERKGISGEVLIADNGSTDGSQSVAEQLGARVIAVSRKGYGAALIAGIESSRGSMIVMGDSDESYDFSQLDPFIVKLTGGFDLVMGNRFKGGIAPGAMPFLHRYLGNPVLSFLGRLFFKTPIGDFHCGLRAFNRQAIRSLNLRCEGMEFASEMIVKASLNRLRITEVPTALSKDGRDRPPHLRTWRDGWRHLRFLLLFTPRWLFLYPGLLLLGLSAVQFALSLARPTSVQGWPIGIHTLLFAAAGLVIGIQTAIFALGAVLARSCARIRLPHHREKLALKFVSGAWLPVAGVVATAIGFSFSVWFAWKWGTSGFGVLNPDEAMRRVIPAVTLMMIGTQCLLASTFFAALRSAFESQRSGIKDE